MIRWTLKIYCYHSVAYLSPLILKPFSKLCLCVESKNLSSEGTGDVLLVKKVQPYSLIVFANCQRISRTDNYNWQWLCILYIMQILSTVAYNYFPLHVTVLHQFKSYPLEMCINIIKLYISACLSKCHTQLETSMLLNLGEIWLVKIHLTYHKSLYEKEKKRRSRVNHVSS